MLLFSFLRRGVEEKKKHVYNNIKLQATGPTWKSKQSSKLENDRFQNKARELCGILSLENLILKRNNKPSQVSGDV